LPTLTGKRGLFYGGSLVQWFKHDADATTDAKLKKVILRHGAEGYAVYFHCLELIAGNVDISHVTFELEHDAEIIADNLRIRGTAEKSGIAIVEDIMRFLVDLGLFSENDGRIYCIKMASRMDKSMVSRPMRSLLESSANHGSAMAQPCTSHGSTMAEPWQEENRIEEKRREEEHTQEVRIEDFIENEQIEKPVPTPSILNAMFPDGYAKAIYDAWSALGSKVYQPANYMAFGNQWRDIREALQGIHSDSVLSAIAMLGEVMDAPPGRYWWTRKVGIRAFITEHLEKFLPANNPLENLKQGKLESFGDRKAREEAESSADALDKVFKKGKYAQEEASP
jgi:hypothetical protein